MTHTSQNINPSFPCYEALYGFLSPLPGHEDCLWCKMLCPAVERCMPPWGLRCCRGLCPVWRNSRGNRDQQTQGFPAFLFCLLKTNPHGLSNKVFSKAKAKIVSQNDNLTEMVKMKRGWIIVMASGCCYPLAMQILDKSFSSSPRSLG